MRGFNKKFKDFPDFILGITNEIWEKRGIESLYHYYSEDIIVRSPEAIVIGNQKVIDAICKKTYQNNVHVRPLWQLVNKIPYFKKNPKMDLSNSKNINRKTLCLPSSPNSIKF